MRYGTRIGLGALVLVSACTATADTSDAGRVVMRDAPLGCYAAASVADGGRCRCVSDCQDGAVCIPEADTGFPGGVCSRSCSVDPCPAGSTCTGSGTRYCEPQCASTADCGPSRVCNDGLCQPWCTSDDECDSGNCNEYSGYCLPAGETPPGTAGLWDPCLRDEDCISDLCSSAYQFCISACSISEQSCPEGAVCVGTSSDPASDWGQCLPSCAGGGACPSGSECLERPVPAGALACTYPIACTTGDGSAGDGAACTCDGDCASGSCFREWDYGAPGGFCYRACSTDRDCTGGTVCGGEFCSPACSPGTGTSCRPGWVCDGLCRPLCQADSDCSTYDTCDLYTGLCGATTTGGGIGATCATDDDCRSGYCNTGGWPEGYCITGCDLTDDVCPEGAYCRPRSSASDYGTCFRACTTTADCAQASAGCVSYLGGPLHCY